MNLPLLKSISKPSHKIGLFDGIGEENLFDSVNLVCNEQCHTRNPRKAVMLYKTAPDQIIPCDNRLFFRFGNTLKEIIKKSDGSFGDTGYVYSLENISPAPDRKIVLWEDKIYVLPDNIQVGFDRWLPFASAYASEMTMPFINPRTLFYPNSYITGDYCDDAALLEVGMKLRFSWDLTTSYTIKTIENCLEATPDSWIEYGIRVTLDADVPNYNNIPPNAKVEYTIPENRPILNDLTLGYNNQVKFSAHSIGIYNNDGRYTFSLNKFFKVGQMVKISGSSIATNNVYTKIVRISEFSIEFDCTFTPKSENFKTIITITPVIPDFSHLLLTENRLFGVDNSQGKFYISALNNPFLFCDSPTVNEDSWSVKINGNATGITLWKDNIICFTEDSGFRILGYHALNFGVRQLSLNGIKKGAGKSLVRVGDTLYYFSGKGIMKYSGGSDRKISDQIPRALNVKSAIADDSFVYMLSDDRIWVYDTELERWWSENAENITELFKFEGQRYLTSPQAIYLAESDLNTQVEWSFELPILSDYDYKKILPLYFVIDCLENTNSVFTLYFKTYDNSNWKSCGVYTAKNEGRIKIPLFKNRCDGFKIKITGEGSFYPNSWAVYYNKIK